MLKRKMSGINRFAKIEQTYDVTIRNNAVLIGAGNTNNTSNAPLFQSSVNNFPQGVNSLQTLLNNNIHNLQSFTFAQKVYTSA